ncbi:MAG: class I SAM-dependent methyltransferase [Myxococcota bacterium]
MQLERSTQQEMLDRWIEPTGRRVVDIGCGSGELVRWLRSRGADAVGVECGEVMMRLAREADPEHAEAYLDGVGQDLPLPDASVDAAVMSFSLHHVPREAMLDALREAHRVLRPGGLLYVAEPISAGAGHEVVSLIDDETEVRALAQAALERAPSVGFEQVHETCYSSPMLLDSAEGFAKRIVGIDPKRAARMADQHDRFVEAFERLAERVDGKYAFDQQVRVRILRKTGRRVPAAGFAGGDSGP